MIAIDDNFKISENGGTGNATIFVSATDKNLFSTASTQVEVSTSVGGNIKRYVTLNKKAAHGYMYTPVEWVSNENLNSDCWIDLGYVWNNNSRAQFKGAYGTSDGNEWFGERITNWNPGGPVDDNGDLRWMYNNSIGRLMWDVPSGKRVEKTSYTLSTPFELEIGNFYIKNLQTGSNLVTGSTYNVSRTNTVGLFSASGGGGVIDKIKFYYIKIYEGDTLIMDIIPVLDKDNIPCFFDKVGEQFYYYKVNGVPSTGLTAGNAIQQLEYLQGDGSDYIVTDYIPTSNTRIEVDCSGRPASTPSSTEGEGTPMGCEKWNGTHPSTAQGGMSIIFPGGSTGGARFYYGNREYDNNTSQKVIERGIFKLDGNAAYIDDFKVADITTSFVTQAAPFALFNSLIYNNNNGTTFPITNFHGGAYYEGKIYGVKIYENNVLVRDYVPCAGASTRGFYDRISGNYLTSVNGNLITGTVIGDLVISVIYSESDIIISNNTPSTAITYGNTFSLEASTTPTGATLTYSSSDTSIATVDSNGVITAVAEGTATITITAQAFQDDTNHIYYNTTSKTVSVETAPPAYMYTPVEWISNEDINSRIWIDLGYTWTNTSKAEIGMIIPTGNTANGTEIFGEWFDWHYRNSQYEPVDDANDIRLFFDYSKCYWDTPDGNRRQLAYEKGKAIIWQFGNQYLNNVNQKTTNTGTTVDIGTRTSTVGLFGAPASGGYTHKARFYYVKIWEGDTLVRDIIPVLDSNNIPCFFDKVNDRFHYYEVDGQPSTGLTAGGAIAEYSYIDNGGVNSSYNCYIPINYVWKTNSRAVMSLKVQSAQRGHLFSDEDGSNRLRLYPYSYGQFQMEYRGTTITASGRDWSNVQNIEIGNYYIKDTDAGNNIATGATKTDNQTTYCFLFGYEDKIQYYSVKIYEGDTLVCDLVPAMANNGYKGLWDKKRCQFFFDRNNQNSRLYVGTKVDDIVVIKDYTLSDITISNDTPSTAINVGTTFNLNASTTPTGATLSYSSSDTSIATVDNSGVVTAVGNGNATITITAQGFDDDVNHITYTSASTTVSLTVGKVSFNPLTDSGYFVVKALSNTKVTFAGRNTSPTIQYRINGASSWHHLSFSWEPDYDDEDFHISLNEGDYAEIKGNITNDYERNPSTTLSDIKLEFQCTTPNSIEIGGYLTALNQNEEINQTNNKVTVSHQYRYLFNGCTGLVSAQYLKLSDNTIENCYQRLFYKCSNLVTPPQQIQVSNLAEGAFIHSFYACTSLTSVPVLSATHIGKQAYGAMFRKCTSLTTVSLLSPRTFDSEACRQMFMDCTNLTSLSMGFSEYDSSTQALNEILSNVTTTGTFYCPSNATYSASDIGLPSTWTLSKTL